VLLAGLGPRGSFDGGYTNLSNIATDVTTAKESHHFYPVLFYFRFDAAYYSVSSITLMSFDVVTLIRSALDEEQGGWLERSAAVRELWWSGAGAEMYIALRAQWEHDIAALAPMMDYAMEEIDPAGTRPERQSTLLTR
jgi:hypothetical protein